jgi:hypothetical protein
MSENIKWRKSYLVCVLTLLRGTNSLEFVAAGYPLAEAERMAEQITPSADQRVVILEVHSLRSFRDVVPTVSTP